MIDTRNSFVAITSGPNYERNLTATGCWSAKRPQARFQQLTALRPGLPLKNGRPNIYHDFWKSPITLMLGAIILGRLDTTGIKSLCESTLKAPSVLSNLLYNTGSDQIISIQTKTHKSKSNYTQTTAWGNPNQAVLKLVPTQIQIHESNLLLVTNSKSRHNSRVWNYPSKYHSRPRGDCGSLEWEGRHQHWQGH